MSMPNIPDINPEICLCFEDVINLLLSSIALQEIALANVINAESEKVQYAIKKNKDCYCIEELIELNDSIEKVLCEVNSIETLLVTKLKHIDQICNKKEKKCLCDKCDDYCDNDMNLDFNNICNKYIDEFNCNCNCNCNNECECDCDCKKDEEIPNHEAKIDNINKNESYKNIVNDYNNNNTYNKNQYYQNYNKLADIFNKILGRSGNRIT